MKKESRHTCTVCGKKRYESCMKPVDICHTGKSVWACVHPFKWSDCARRFEYDKPSGVSDSRSVTKAR